MNPIIVLKSLPFFFLVLAASGCSSHRPVLYPNERLAVSGRDMAEQEINDCVAKADAYISSGGRAGEIAGSAAAEAGTGAAIGAAAGGAGGAVLGHAGRGAAVGAAGAAAGGLTRGLIRGLFASRRPDPVVKNYVDRCLREKGYDVIGWK